MSIKDFIITRWESDTDSKSFLILSWLFEIIAFSIALNIIMALTAMNLAVLGYLPVVSTNYPSSLYVLLGGMNLFAGFILTFMHRLWIRFF